MFSKNQNSRTNSYLMIFTLVIILTILGIISEQFFHKRLDLTSNKQFTLSKASVKTLAGLPDLITIKAVMSKDLPTQFAQIRTNVVDLLHEFEAQSNGKVKLVFEDPGESESKKQSATALGIQEVQLQEQSSEGLQIKKGFFGLALLYGDKKEVIPVLQNLESFEYDLIVKLKKLTGSVKTIGIVEGSEKFSFTLSGPQPKVTTGFDENYPTVKEEAGKLYKLEKLDLATNEIGTNIDLLLVFAPNRLSEKEKFRIDQFLMKGKSILFLSPGVNINLASGISGMASNNGYEDLLAEYGLAVKKNIILEDRSYEFVRFGNSFFPTPYPHWIRTGAKGLNLENPITSKLGSISLPWTSEVVIDSSKKGNAKIEILASSTKGSWEEENSFNLLPRDLKEYLPVNQKVHALAVLKSGSFNSYYAKHPIPFDSTHPIDPNTVLKSTQGDARVLVIGNALFATDFYAGLTQAVANLHFILNSFDHLALDPDLISIRSREFNNVPILDEKKNLKLPILLIDFLLAPIVLLIIGVTIGIRRKSKESLS